MSLPDFLCSFDNASPFGGWTGGASAIATGRTLDGAHVSGSGFQWKDFTPVSSISVGLSINSDGWTNDIIRLQDGISSAPGGTICALSNTGDGRVIIQTIAGSYTVPSVGISRASGIWYNLQYQVLTSVLAGGGYQVSHTVVLNGQLILQTTENVITAPQFGRVLFFGPGGGLLTTLDNVWIDWTAALLWGDLTVNPDDISVFANQSNIRATQHGIEILASVPEDDLNLACPIHSTAPLGVSYSQTILASGGTPPYSSYTITAGALPTGLSLNSTTGVISGIPSVLGTYWFTESVTDSAGTTVEINCVIYVTFGLTLACPVTNTGTVGTFFTATIQASGGIPPYTFSVGGSLPPGISLTDAVNGILSGTPAVAGIFGYTVSLVDSAANTAGPDTCAITISVLPPSTCAVPAVPSSPGLVIPLESPEQVGS